MIFKKKLSNHFRISIYTNSVRIILIAIIFLNVDLRKENVKKKEKLFFYEMTFHNYCTFNNKYKKK